MTIQVGQTLPSATVYRFGDAGIEGFDAAADVAGKRVVIIGVPGAFTPSCNEKHLPGYIANADKFRAQGIDAIICVSVNDVFVQKAWSAQLDADSKVTFWSDGNAALTKALGLELDAAGIGLGLRCKRFAMVVNNGVVETLDVEEKASDVEASSAGTCLLRLAA